MSVAVTAKKNKKTNKHGKTWYVTKLMNPTTDTGIGNGKEATSRKKKYGKVPKKSTDSNRKTEKTKHIKDIRVWNGKIT